MQCAFRTKHQFGTDAPLILQVEQGGISRLRARPTTAFDTEEDTSHGLCHKILDLRLF